MRILLSLVLCLLGAAEATAASFDCAKAASPREKAVCADPALSKADERLAATFATALKATLNPHALRIAEHQWLNGLQNLSTLGHDYDERIAALEATIDEWRSMAHEIDAAALGKGCLAFPDAPADAVCTVDDSGTIASHEDNFLYQLQSYAGDGARLGGGVIVLERASEAPTGRESGRLRFRVAAFGEDAHYDPPQLTGSRVASWLLLPGHLEGTGAFNAELLFFFDPEGGLHDVDTDTWQSELSRRLPKGLGVWKGIYPDYGKMTVRTALWQDGDGNCCPTGGEVAVRLGLKGQRLVIEDLKVVPAAADDPDRGTDLCGKRVAYKVNDESFGDDKTALETAGKEAPSLIHRAFKALCAKKALSAGEVAQRIDTVTITLAGGADNFAAYFPRDKARPKTLATEWIWQGTEVPEAEDVRAGILCAFKPKQPMCREREP